MKFTRAVTAAVLTVISTLTGLLVTTTAAQAEACAKGKGVTVVVGQTVRCDDDGGGPAMSNFDDAGFKLTPVTSDPEFICQVDSKPKRDCATMPKGNAYWGLFVADAKREKWTFAQEGATSLQVPSGGAVAFVYQTSSEPQYPSTDAFSDSTPSAQSPADETDDEKSASDTTMWWLGAAVVVLLLAGGAWAVVQRRRSMRS